MTKMKQNIPNFFINEKLKEIANSTADEIIKNRQDVEAVFICGSYVEGLADSYSDFDMRVLTDSYEEKKEYNIKSIKMSILYLDKKRFINAISNYEYRLIRWIMNSIILYDKNDLISRLRNDVIDKLIELVTRQLGNSITRSRDALGSYEKNDHEAAIVSARLSAQHAAQALLLSKKRFNIRPRWVYDQLKDLKDLASNYLLDYSQILGFKKLNENNTKNIILKTFKFINYIINDQIPRSEPFQLVFKDSIKLNLTSLPNECKGPTRNPWIVWIKYPDESVVIYGRAGKEYEQRGSGGLIWQLLDGTRSTVEIAIFISEFYNISFEIALRDISNFIKDLMNEDLIIKMN